MKENTAFELIASIAIFVIMSMVIISGAVYLGKKYRELRNIETEMKAYDEKCDSLRSYRHYEYPHNSGNTEGQDIY